jgi:hypothetical protein
MIAAFSVLLVLFAGAPALAQVHVTTFDALRRELSRGDVISIVDTNGNAIDGRVLRVGSDDIDVRIKTTSVAVPLSAIRSLQRRRDPD